ncbi:MAG: protein kinase [Acidobacteriota bacterium]
MISETISHYKVLEKLGEGGMGEVYLAEDTRLGRQVALKFLPASFQYDPERRSRFLREARAASALRSPYVAAIYDIGEHDDRQFIAMEYVEGQLISKKIESGNLSIHQAIDIAAQIAEALDEAHNLGIIHRDIKCANIIVTERGITKVLDFGLAKVLSQIDESELDENRTLIFGKETSPGVVLGTVAYMSPEQARGLALDGRSDLFSLGVMLYEMVTGRKPFSGETISDLIVAILEREPAPLTHYSENIPQPLQWIISKALRKRCDERYQTARDFAVDLKNLKKSLELEDSGARTSQLERHSGAINHRTGEMEALTVKLSEDSFPSATMTPPKRRSRKAINSIAILPLVNASNDPNTEYLSDGITETLINNLSRLPKLKVMARSTTFRYKGQNVDPLLVGNELNVRAVLTGRVLQLGENLVIGTELVDASDGSHLWGEQYQRKLSDIFKVQEEISNEILDQLRLKLGSKEKKVSFNCCTESTRAYELYLKGRFHFNKWTYEGFSHAIDFFQQAIAIDKKFALAYSGLADSYGTLWFFNLANSDEVVKKARDYTLRAIELDDNLAEAHLSLANMQLFYEWDWLAAEKCYKRALALNPNSVQAHHAYAFYLLSAGRFDEAIAYAERSVELDPLTLINQCAVAGALTYAGKLDEALAFSKKILEFDEAFPMTYERLFLIYKLLGEYDKAVETILTVLPAWIPSREIAEELKTAYQQSGMKGFWQRWLDFATDGKSIPTAPLYYLVAGYAILGETERAFAWLETAYQSRQGFLAHLKVEPRLKVLNSDPRFAELIQRVGIP